MQERGGFPWLFVGLASGARGRLGFQARHNRQILGALRAGCASAAATKFRHRRAACLAPSSTLCRDRPRNGAGVHSKKDARPDARENSETHRCTPAGATCRTGPCWSLSKGGIARGFRGRGRAQTFLAGTGRVWWCFARNNGPASRAHIRSSAEKNPRGKSTRRRCGHQRETCYLLGIPRTRRRYRTSPVCKCRARFREHGRGSPVQRHAELSRAPGGDDMPCRHCVRCPCWQNQPGGQSMHSCLWVLT